jgi:hypothetical protein
MATAGHAAEQSSTTPAWFGLPPPGPITEQVVDFSKVDMPVVGAPAVNRAPELAGDRLLDHIRHIVAFSYRSRDAGAQFWGRMAGSAATDDTTAYVAEQLRAAGLKVVQQSVPFTSASDPIGWRVRLLGSPEFGAQSEPIELHSALPMAIAPNRSPGAGAVGPPTSTVDASGTRTVTAPVVFVGDGSSSSLTNVDVHGKVAVLVIEPAPSAFYSESVREGLQRVAQAGAVGALAIYDMPGNMQLMFGICSVELLCYTLGGEDGSFLRAVIERAAAAHALPQLRAELTVTRSAPQPRQAQMLVAKLAGRDARENIVVSAHSDAYFAGADDNASGVAALIALAQHLAHGPKPHHDFYFFLSPGHHSATNATAALVHYDASIPSHNIVLLNLEHIGQAGVYRSYIRTVTDRYGARSAQWIPTNWDSPGREVTLAPDSPAIKRAWADAANRELFTAPAVFSGPAVAEPAPFVAAGGAAIQDVETSPWFHTTGDTPAAISAATMQRATLFYLDFIETMDRLSRAQVRAGTPDQ